MEREHTIFFVMAKGMIGYVILMWVGLNIINIPMSIGMLLADAVVPMATFWLGFTLMDIISRIVWSVIRKKEELTE